MYEENESFNYFHKSQAYAIVFHILQTRKLEKRLNNVSKSHICVQVPQTQHKEGHQEGRNKNERRRNQDGGRGDHLNCCQWVTGSALGSMQFEGRNEWVENDRFGLKQYNAESLDLKDDSHKTELKK